MPATSVDISKFIASLNEFQEQAAECARRAITRLATEILALAKTYCPEDTGDLIRSGDMKELVEDGYLFWREVGFYVHYAAAVHERLTNKISGKVIAHSTGQAKFLERAMKELSGKLMDYFEEELAALK